MTLETQPSSQDTTKTPAQKLAEETGIPEKELTLEQIEKYEAAKKVDKKLDFLEIKAAGELSKKILLLNEMLEKLETQKEDIKDVMSGAATEAAAGTKKELSEALEDTPENVAQWAAEKTTTQAKSWLSTNIPFGLGDSLSGVADSLGNPIKQIILALSSAFGGLGIIKWLKKKFNWGEKETPASESEETDTPTTAPIETTIPGEEQEDETTLSGLPRINKYRAGAKLIVALGVSMGEERLQDTDPSYDAIENMSYKDILALGSSHIPEGFYESAEAAEGKGELYTKIIGSLQSKDTQDLLRISLKTPALENIIAPRGELNSHLFEYFGENAELGKQRLEAILTLSREGKLDWKDLKFQEISILFLYSFPALRIPVIDGMGNLGESVKNLILGEDLQQGMISISEATIPQELMLGFARVGTLLSKQDSLKAYKHNEIRNTVLADIPEEARTESERVFEDIMRFKQEVMSPSFYTHAKLRLTAEQQEVFTDHLSLASVLVLYGILGGNSSLKSISGLALPPLIYSVGSILGAGGEANARVSGMYLGGYVKNTLSDTNSPLTEDEKIIMSIYGEKILDLIVLQHLDTVAKNIGMTEGITGLDLNELAIGAFVGGGVLRFSGGKIISGALKNNKVSFLGLGLKRFGNIGMLAGLALGGVSWYTNFRGDSFQKDLSSAVESGDLEKVSKTLQLHQDSIKQITTSQGKTISILAYPGDTPVYIIDGKVYGVKVGDLNLIEKWNKSDKDFWDKSWDVFRGVPDMVFPSTGISEGIDYTIQRHDGENIIFGEDENQISIPMIDIIEKSMVGKPEILGEDMVRQISSGENYLPVIGNEGERGYIIQNMDGGKVMVLTEIGDTQDLFSPQNTD